MDKFFSGLTLLQTSAPAAADPLGGLGGILPMLLVIPIFYFLIIRPQNKKQKEAKAMLAAMKKGDKVVTIGGLHGIISSMKENTVILKVDDSTKLEYSKSAIQAVIAKGETEAEKPVEAAAAEQK